MVVLELDRYTHASMAIEAATTAKDAGLGRLAYDALKWNAYKMLPKVYGDKTEVAVVRANGGPVRSVTVRRPIQLKPRGFIRRS